MNRVLVVIFSVLIIGLGAAPCRAQDPSLTPPAQPPVFSLKFPSFIPAAPAAEPEQLSLQTEMHLEGGVPVPTPTYANQSQQPFKQATLLKTIQYGLQLTFYEHVMRVATQEFTREQLKGPFWQDYFDSLHMPTALARQRQLAGQLPRPRDSWRRLRAHLDGTARTAGHVQDAVFQADGPCVGLRRAHEPAV